MRIYDKEREKEIRAIKKLQKMVKNKLKLTTKKYEKCD